MRNQNQSYQKRTSQQKHSSRRSIRSFALLTSFLLILIHISRIWLQIPADIPAISAAGSPYAAFTYQFFHASFFHLLANIWSWLIIAFYWKPSYPTILTAYLISLLCGLLITTLPSSYLSFFSPTIGFSSIIYSFIGIYTFRFIQSTRFLLTALLLIALTALLPHISWQIHLSCLLMGLLVSLLTSPLLSRS